MKTTMTRICKTCGRELPIENFKMSRTGERVSVCTECAVKKMRESRINNRLKKEAEKQEEARVAREQQDVLSQFTPRQLMEELARRGYKGELTYVQKIDITHF